MIVRGEKRLRAELFGVDRVLQNRSGNRHAVEGRRAAPDFVENQKRPWRRVFENVRHLVHFHHERRLPRGKIVGRADAGEELIDNADARACRRHEASHLRHEDNQRHLTHVGGFARHVGARDDCRTAAVCAKDRVVRNEERVFEHLLDDRVPALRDADFIRKIDLGAAVVVVDGGACKAAKHVEAGDCLRGFLHALRLLGDPCAQLRENFVFQRDNPVLRAENRRLQFFELLRDIALAGR